MALARYSRAAIALHWAIAMLLAFQLGLGWQMVNLENPGAMYAPFQFHKSIGMTVLALSLVRVVIRYARPRPAAHAGGWLGRLASIVHGTLYAFMIGGPLTGWMLVSTARIAIPTLLFGKIPLPHLPISRSWHTPAESAHELLAWLGAALIVLHVAGALRHHLSNTETGIIDRMMPGAGQGRRALFPGIAGALTIAAAFVLPWFVYAPAAKSPETEASAMPEPIVSETSLVAEAAMPEATAVASEAAALPDGQTPKWQIFPGGALTFKVLVNGEAVEGRLSGWSADVMLDPEDTSDGSITVRIPVLSARTGDDTRDTMLKGEDFFGAGPTTAVYRSTSIAKLGASTYSAAGKLSLNGVTKPVDLRFTLSVENGVATVKGTGTLARTAFGVGTGDFAGTEQIADAVNVAFAFKAKQVK